MGRGWWGVAEGTRDTGFMLEWMFFVEGLQEDCAICYFLGTATSCEPENCQEVQGASHKQFVCLAFLCTPECLHANVLCVTGPDLFICDV